MSSEAPEAKYYYRINYRTWLKIMKDIVEFQKNQMNFYLNMLYNCDKVAKTGQSDLDEKLAEVSCTYYFGKLVETLQSYLHNMDLIYLVSANKEHYEFYIDEFGNPYAHLVGKTLKKMRKRLESSKYIF